MDSEKLPNKIGAYRILRVLGAGGMGVVYEGINEEIERRVAVKVLLPECARNHQLTQRFFNEARAVNRINHPCIVQVSDFGQSPEGAAFIVMELLEGESLGKRLSRLGGCSKLSRTLQIAWQVATALTAAHAKNIVHRDLKPDNVMLVPDPVAPGGERAKLLDFGIAKLAADARMGQTASQNIMGTPSYMSPEQCRGAGAVDDKSDVYSLGVMLFQLLAGRLPFYAEGAGELLAMHMYKEPPRLAAIVPHLPNELTELVQSLLQKDRVLRPAMCEVAARLELMLGQDSSGVRSGQLTLPPLREPAAVGGAINRSTLGQSTGQSQKKRTETFLQIGIAAAFCLLGVGVGVPYLRKEYLRVGISANQIGKAEHRALPTAGFVSTTPAIPGNSVAREIAAEPLEEGGAVSEVTPHFTAQPTTSASADAQNINDAKRVKRKSPQLPGLQKLAGAERLLGKSDWEAALQAAQDPVLLRDHPMPAWRIIGTAACHLRRTTLASAAYGNASESGQETIRRECTEVGVTLNEAHDAQARTATDVLHTASEHLFRGRYREAIAAAQGLTAKRPADAWRVIGNAACAQRDAELAAQARRALSAQAQPLIDQACDSSGLTWTGTSYTLRAR